MFTALLLSITGVPYLFTSGAVASMPTSTDARWFGADPNLAIANGALVGEGLRWGDRAKPLDGDCDSDGLTFALRDMRVTSGIAAGKNLVTWLAAREAVNLTSTPLVASISRTDTSFDVGSGAVLAGVDWIWVNREAMRVTSVVGNTVTVVRGALGTRAVEHVVSAEDGLSPEAFTAVPWVQRRKVVLWGRRRDGTAQALWMGFCVRAPRLSADGKRFELVCDPYLEVVKACPVGDTTSYTRIVGYGQVQTQGASLVTPSLLRIQTRRGIELPAYGQSQNTYRTWEALTADVAAQLATQSAQRGGRIDPWFSRSGAGARIDLDADTTFSAGAHWLGEDIADRASSQRSASPAREWVSIPIESLPEVAYVGIQGATMRFCVASSSRFPSSWAPSTLDGPTTVSRALRTTPSRDFHAELVSVTEGSSTSLGPYVEGWLNLRPRAFNVEIPPHVVLRNPPPLQVIWRVQTEHWAQGLRYGALPQVSDADDADWDWSTMAEVIRATAGHNTRRGWTFDGRRLFGDLLGECARLSGCSLVIRGDGRAALKAWSWPTVGATPAAQIDTRRDVVGTVGWSTFEDGLANRMEIKSEGFGGAITDAGSIARYGPGRKLEVALAGVDAQDTITDDPVAFARVALGRLSLWAEPIPTVRMTLTLRHLGVELGDLVEITDWLVPTGDAAGGRGLDARRGAVIGRTVDLDRGRVELELVMFPREAYGYAPCARIASVIAADTIEIGKNYVQAAYDYAGGSDGMGGDGSGSQSIFAVGDRVQLLTRDSFTLTAEDRIISAITWNAGSWEVQFTAAMSAPMQAAIGLGPCDMRFSAWSTAGLQAAQKRYMYIADEATRTIGGAEPARPIAP